MLSQRELTGKKCHKNFPKARTCVLALEVETYSTKLANETSPRTPMQEIKRQEGGELARTVPTACVTRGVKP
jgi:hypothetical protein